MQGLRPLVLSEAAVCETQEAAAVDVLPIVRTKPRFLEGLLCPRDLVSRQVKLPFRYPLLRHLAARVDGSGTRQVVLRREQGRLPLPLGLCRLRFIYFVLREAAERLNSLELAPVLFLQLLIVVLSHVVVRYLLEHVDVLLLHSPVVVDPRRVHPILERRVLGHEQVNHELSVAHVFPRENDSHVRLGRGNIKDVLLLL